MSRDTLYITIKKFACIRQNFGQKIIKFYAQNLMPSQRVTVEQ